MNQTGLRGFPGVLSMCFHEEHEVNAENIEDLFFHQKQLSI